MIRAALVLAWVMVAVLGALGVYAGLEIAMAPPKPTNDEIRKALRSSNAMLARDFAQLGNREELTQEALIYAHEKWDGGRTFVAFVKWKAKKLALNAARDLKRRAEIFENGPSSTAATALYASEQALREATIQECRARVLTATGDEGKWWLDELVVRVTPDAIKEEREGARAARAVLRALQGAPAWVTEKVDVEAMRRFATLYGNATWHSIAGQRIGIGYVVDGEVRKYGATQAEAAVLSILLGSWPKVSVETSTPADVIEREADAIRKATAARQKDHPESDQPEIPDAPSATST